MQSFDNWELDPKILKGLARLEFVEPTKIQTKAIPAGLAGKDIIACAETGSGKTGAFAIPMVQHLLENPDTKGLVLAPTRELAQQILRFIQDLTKRIPKFGTVLIVGGSDMGRQARQLKLKPRIIVATPGRLNDHLEKKNLTLKSASHLVLDEGDRMLDMGFAPQLDRILKYLPENRQTSLFTATLPPKVQKLAKEYLRENPEMVTVGPISQPVKTVTQAAILMAARSKQNRLLDEVNARKGSMIVFVRTKRRADRLAKFLLGYNLPVDLMHGGRTQGQRNQALRNFREESGRILCATDVAARGLDIPHVEHVINYDLPAQEEDYVHRIGRTARNGAEGMATTFVAPEDVREWNRIVAVFGIENAKLTNGGGDSEGRSERRGRGRGDGDRGRQSKRRKPSQKAAQPKRRTRSEDREDSPRSRPARETLKTRNDRTAREDRRAARKPQRARTDRPASKNRVERDEFSSRNDFSDRKSRGESRPRRKDRGKYKEESQGAESPRADRRAKNNRNADAKWKPSPKKRKIDKRARYEERVEREANFTPSGKQKKKSKLQFMEKLNFKTGKSKLDSKLKTKPKRGERNYDDSKPWRSADTKRKPRSRESGQEAPVFGVPGKKRSFGKKRSSGKPSNGGKFQKFNKSRKPRTSRSAQASR